MQSHHMGSQEERQAALQNVSVHFQPQTPSNAPVESEVMTTAIGWQRFQAALARARSALGNQLASRTTMDG